MPSPERASPEPEPTSPEAAAPELPPPVLLRTARGDFEALVAGPQDGRPVVLLHGFPELNVSWRGQIPALARAGYRVIAPNQRGYAGSVRGGPYGRADLAADVVALLDTAGAARAVLVGHDWGGAVAWTVARLHPQRVSALVAMNCPPPEVLAAHAARSPAQLRKSWYVGFFQLPRLPERWVAERMPGMIVAGSHNRSAWTRQSLAPYAQALGTPEDLEGPLSWYRAALRPGGRRGVRPARIEVPVLVVWGVHDRFLGMEMVSPEALLAVLAYPNVADVVPIESAGHYVQNEAAEDVTAVLMDWLDEHGGATRTG